MGMLEILTLTVRELDLAPLLVANATRREIARHLEISEETAKHHTRNILRKFEATNVRDAFETLSEHLYVFSKDGLGVNYFCRRFERHLYLKQNRIDALVKENITFDGIYSPMIEFVTEHYVINGSKENIRVNVEPFEEHERIGVKIASVKKRPNQVAFGRLIKS